MIVLMVFASQPRAEGLELRRGYHNDSSYERLSITKIHTSVWQTILTTPFRRFKRPCPPWPSLKNTPQSSPSQQIFFYYKSNSNLYLKPAQSRLRTVMSAKQINHNMHSQAKIAQEFWNCKPSTHYYCNMKLCIHTYRIQIKKVALYYTTFEIHSFYYKQNYLNTHLNLLSKYFQN
jgi:hypothetical protein